MAGRARVAAAAGNAKAAELASPAPADGAGAAVIDEYR